MVARVTIKKAVGAIYRTLLAVFIEVHEEIKVQEGPWDLLQPGKFAETWSSGMGILRAF